MLILKLKRAEVALADGRLEEAFDLVRQESLREHRRGQRLATRLFEALIKRAQEHIDAQRPREALSDLGKAEQLGGNDGRIVELRRAAQQALDAAMQAERLRRQELAAANHHAAAGQFSLAHGLLAELADDPHVVAAKRELEHKRAAAMRMIEAAEAALTQGSLISAINHLDQARRQGGAVTQLQQIAAELRTSVSGAIHEALTAGRLDLAHTLAQAAQSLAADDLRLSELFDALSDCRRAAAELQSGRAERAAVLLRHARRVIGDAAWLKEAIEQAQTLANQWRELEAGPLGLLRPSRGGHDAPEASEAPDAPEARDQIKRDPIPAPALGDVFLLHVDGGGSCIVCASPSVTIGPRSSRRGVDVPLMADAGMPVVTVQRSDEDYFVNASGGSGGGEGVALNGRPITRGLLADGDRLELTSRARMRFHRPNPASTSAVMSLDGLRIASTDARKIVLLDRELVIGPPGNSGSHVRVDRLSRNVVLCRRAGDKQFKVMCGDLPPQVVSLNQPVKIAGVSLCISEVTWR